MMLFKTLNVFKRLSSNINFYILLKNPCWDSTQKLLSVSKQKSIVEFYQKTLVGFSGTFSANELNEKRRSYPQDINTVKIYSCG